MMSLKANIKLYSLYTLILLIKYYELDKDSHIIKQACSRISLDHKRHIYKQISIILIIIFILYIYKVEQHVKFVKLKAKNREKNILLEQKKEILQEK